MPARRRVAAAMGLIALVALIVFVFSYFRHHEPAALPTAERVPSVGAMPTPDRASSPSGERMRHASRSGGESPRPDSTGAERIERATRLSGRVLAASDGSARAGLPIPTALVSVVTADGEPILEAAPDERGAFRFEIHALPPPGFGLRVTAPGFLAVDRRGPFEPGRDHDLGTIELLSGARISGRVLDVEGRPLRAEVTLYLDEDGGEDGGSARAFVTLLDVVDALLADAQEIARTTTDETGRFVFDSLAETRYAIRARAPGREDGVVEGILLSPPRRTVERDLRLNPGGVVSGRVSHPDGTPVGGCRVIAILAGSGWPPPDRTYPTVTGSDGRFSIGGLPLARMIVIVPTPDGAITLSREVFPPIHGVDVTLERRVRITGVVRDRDTDEPIPNAQVFGITADLSVSIARTDDEGRFALALSRSDGDASLLASAAGYADRNESVEVPADADSVECPIRLASGFELRGTVIRRDDGTPVPGASVVASAGGIGDGALSRAETDESGSFGLRVAPGRVRLRVAEVAGLAPEARQSPLEVQVDSGTPPDHVTIELVPTARIRIGVVRASGEPVAGARVRLLGLPAGDDRGPWETDGAGVVARASVAAGAQVTAFAESPDGATGLSDATSIPLEAAGATEIRVVLGPPATVRGRVVDAAAGFAVGGAVVSFEPRRIGNRPDLDAEQSFIASFSRRITTAADGRFELVIGLVGTGDLAVIAEGYPYFRVQKIASGVEDREIDVALLAGLELTGRVVDATESPVGGAWVSIERSNTPKLVIRSGDDGFFRTKEAPSPPFTIRTNHPGHRETTMAIQSPEALTRELTLRLRKRRD